MQQNNSQAIFTKKVSFTSDNEKIVGNLYFPANYQIPNKYPAIVITGSWTSVKEQMAEIYAKELAKRGFITLAFDFRNFGESEGKIRALESAKLKMTDIHQASEFLRQQPEVANNYVAGLSLCASSGYMAHAIANGAPIKSFATVAAWLHNAETAKQIYTPAYYDLLIQSSQKAKINFEENGTIEYIAAFSMTDKQAAMQAAEPGYYGDEKRGAISQWDNRFAVMAWEEWLTFDALSPASHITVPTLLVHSDESALPDNVRQFYKDLKAQKALYWMQGQHLNFYDQPELVEEAADIVAVYFSRCFKHSNAIMTN